MPLPLAVPALFVGVALPIIVFRVLALLGIGIITYIGSQELISEINSQLNSAFNDFPSELLPLLGKMNVDRFMSMIVSSYGIAFGVTLVKKIGLRK